ncbi:hypothetical protein O3P69_006829 [Scylla paramamosain]|uniref:Uncharacterized protein n=1 Tax=Scylla paramamosain TaxID=85552 RepID=A0AAW0U5X9_SCYPA
MSRQSLSRLYLEDNRRATLQAGFSVASDHRTSLVTWTQSRRVRLNPQRSVPTTHRESLRWRCGGRTGPEGVCWRHWEG